MTANPTNVSKPKKVIKKVVKKKVPETVTESVTEAVTEAVIDAVTEAVTEAVADAVADAVTEATEATEVAPKVRKPRKKKEVKEKEEKEVKVKEVKEVKEVQEGGEKDKKKPEKRNFTILYVNDHKGEKSSFAEGGKYASKTPAGAARKAANHACKFLYKDENCVIEVGIKETTKNSNGKEYAYRAERTFNQKCVEFKGSNGEIKIPFNYSMVLKSLKKGKEPKLVLASEMDTTVN
jgi:hypothetical protein